MIFNSKFKNQKSKSYFFTLFLLFTFYFLLFSKSIFAQESSPSGTLLDKLNQLKSEIASKAAQIKTEINKKVQDKAVIGSISSINSLEMRIKTINNPRTVKFDEFTEVIGLKNKKIEIDTLEEEDNIAALGDVDDKNNLVAQKIIFLENFATGSSQLVWGQIQKTTGNIITIKNRDNESKNILTNSQTAFFLGNEEASIADSKVEKRLVARGTRLNDGSLRARFIYFIPSQGFTKPAEKTFLIKSASPSATKKP